MEDREMSEQELCAWLRLVRVPGIGSLALTRLIDHFGDPESVLAADDHALNDVGIRSASIKAIRVGDARAVDLDLAWLSGSGHHCVTTRCPAYPRLLREIPGAPPLLFVNGSKACLSRPQLAIVGSRKPTPDGMAQARDFARALAGNGLVTTSGLALGVDGAVHRATIASGGVTIAVMATGPESVYPSRHRALAEDIVSSGGALISEFGTGTPPRAGQFPRRNRIISGLAMGTLVIEASLRSGSLITARCCLEQGRELFAIPGSIRNQMVRGCHHLIRNGAKLTESIDDVLSELGPLASVVLNDIDGHTHTAPENGGAHGHLLELMGFSPFSLDELVHRSGIKAGELSGILLLMELENQVISLPGGLYLRGQRQGNQ